MVGFTENALKEYWQWEEEDRKIYKKINSLIRDIMRDPFRGLGKPEPLKHDLAGIWSRRITDEHRLLYKVLPDHIKITSCKSHYN